MQAPLRRVPRAARSSLREDSASDGDSAHAENHVEHVRDLNRVMRDPIFRPGVILDYDEENQVAGVEFLGISARASDEELSSIQCQTVWQRTTLVNVR